MSQAEFFKPNRRIVNLWRLPLCFVDLDTHKTDWGRLSPEPVSLAVRMFLGDEGIPPASLIIHSGCGLYLKWLFANALPSAALSADHNTKQTDPELRKVRVLHVEEVNGETFAP